MVMTFLFVHTVQQFISLIGKGISKLKDRKFLVTTTYAYSFFFYQQCSTRTKRKIVRKWTRRRHKRSFFYFLVRRACHALSFIKAHTPNSPFVPPVDYSAFDNVSFSSFSRLTLNQWVRVDNSSHQHVVRFDGESRGLAAHQASEAVVRLSDLDRGRRSSC